MRRLKKEIADLNEIAFTELILSIDVSNSNGKIAFGIVKSCKSKEFEDGNAALAWEKLKKKYDPISAPLLVKTERMFRESMLGKNEDPEIWINNLEDLPIKFETMGSNMTVDQFIVQVLNSLTSDYELQMLLLEKQVGNKDNPLFIADFKKELNLQFERLSTGQNDNMGKESALFTSQFKGKCRNCGKLGHKAAQCKSKQVKDEKSDVMCNYCKKSGHVKANCFKLLRKNSGMNSSGGTQNGQNGVGGTADAVLSSMTTIEDFDIDIWIGDSGASCHYCNNDAALYDYTIISEDITVGNGNVMTAPKMGKLRCQILQKNGERFVVTLEDVKFVPDLWINLFSIGKALKNGFNLGNDGETIKLMKGKTVILFDRCLKSKNGFVPAIKLKTVLPDIGVTVVNTKKGKPKNSINVNSLHKILGHCGEASARCDRKGFGLRGYGSI
jgi:gag-polypeptide of LTR copia-type/Zinc knuckle